MHIERRQVPLRILVPLSRKLAEDRNARAAGGRLTAATDSREDLSAFPSPVHEGNSESVGVGRRRPANVQPNK